MESIKKSNSKIRFNGVNCVCYSDSENVIGFMNNSINEYTLKLGLK